MPVKPLLFGALAAACVAAAAGGAYVAVRQSPATTPASVSEPAAGAASAGSTSPAPVTETEGVVTPPAGAPDAVAEAPAPAPAPAPNPERTPKKEAPARQVPPAPASKSVAVRPNPAPAAPTRHDAPVDRHRPACGLEPAGVVRRSTRYGELPRSRRMPLPRRPAHPTAPAPEPRYVEVVVPASAVIGLQVDRALSSETAKVEDRIEARVTRDVMADGQRAIPAGSKMLGSVVLVDRGGKMKDAARLGVRFHTLVLADGTELPLRTETIYRDGDSPGNESSRKVGGAAVGGAILGAILGGGKGAVLGGAAGAAGGTAAVMAGGRNPATLPAGTVVTARVAGPVTVQVEKE